MIIYLCNLNRRKSGGAHSQMIVSKMVEENQGIVLKIMNNSWYVFLRNFFRYGFLKKETKSIFLINSLETRPNKILGIYFEGYFIKRIINKLIFYLVIKNLGSKFKETRINVISEVFNLDFIKILREFFNNIKIGSLLRSSPHCLIWSQSFLLRDKIINCINNSEFIISASRDVADMWIDASKNSKINYFQINVPIEEKKLINLSFRDSFIYSFICICGSVGPRKGIFMMINSVGNAMKKMNKKAQIIILGDCSNYIINLINEKLIPYKDFLEVHLKGYQTDALDLVIDKNKSLFIFCSYSENQSRAHLEALKYGLPIFINSKSISSELFEVKDDSIRLFSSSINLQDEIINFIKSNFLYYSENKKFKEFVTIKNVRNQLINFDNNI